jgi:hypothetical protein
VGPNTLVARFDFTMVGRGIVLVVVVRIVVAIFDMVMIVDVVAGGH